MGITGIYNIEIGQRLHSEVRSLYQEVLELTGRPDICPQGRFSVEVGPRQSSMAGILTFGGSGVSIRAVTFAVARGTLRQWRARLSQRGVRLIGRAWQFGEEYLCFIDDADFDLALTEVDVDRGSVRISDANGIYGLRSVEIEAGPHDELQLLLETIGLKADREEGPIIRYEVRPRASAVAVDLFRSATAIDLFRSATIVFQHEPAHRKPQRVNFAVSDLAALDDLEKRVRSAGFSPVPFCARAAAFVVGLRSHRNLELGFLCLDQAA